MNSPPWSTAKRRRRRPRMRPRPSLAAGGNKENMPTSTLQEKDFDENGQIGAISLLVACGLAPSRGEARRLIQQGGVVVSDEKVSDIDQKWGAEAFRGEGVIIRKGKKVFHRAVLQ